MDDFNFFEYGVDMAGMLPFDVVDFIHMTSGEPIDGEVSDDQS